MHAYRLYAKQATARAAVYVLGPKVWYTFKQQLSFVPAAHLLPSGIELLLTIYTGYCDVEMARHNSPGWHNWNWITSRRLTLKDINLCAHHAIADSKHPSTQESWILYVEVQRWQSQSIFHSFYFDLWLYSLCDCLLASAESYEI